MARSRALKLLDSFGLSLRAEHFPGKLSGGEKQRNAIARALADEPTGNLDANTSALVFSELLEVSRKFGVGALIATHNNELAQQMDRRIHLVDGRLN